MRELQVTNSLKQSCILKIKKNNNNKKINCYNKTCIFCISYFFSPKNSNLSLSKWAQDAYKMLHQSDAISEHCINIDVTYKHHVPIGVSLKQ